MRILVIKLDHMGDLIWATPALRRLRKHYPDAHISLAALPQAAEVVAQNPDVDEILFYVGSKQSPFYRETLDKLRKDPYDLAVVLGPVDRYNYLAYLSGARERIGFVYSRKPLSWMFNQITLTERILHPADTSKIKERWGKTPHEVDSMGRLLDHLGVGWKEAPRPSLSVLPADHAFAVEFLGTDFTRSNRIIGLQLTLKSYAWGWKSGHLIKLARKVLDLIPDSTIVLTYGPEERTIASELEPLIQEPRTKIIGELPLGRWAALLSRCRLLISWDTGAIHVAATQGVPVIDLFPSRGFEYCSRRFGPWGVANRCLRLREELGAGAHESMILEILLAVEDLLPHSALEATLPVTGDSL